MSALLRSILYNKIQQKFTKIKKIAKQNSIGVLINKAIFILLKDEKFVESVL